MTKVSYVVLLSLLAFAACKNASFQKGDEGMEYKIISDGKGQPVKYGEFMEFEVAQLYNNGKIDSVLTDSRTSAPLIEMLDSVSTPPAYFKILKQLRNGDSLVIRIMSDSAFKRSPESMPPFIKKGHYLLTTVKVTNVYKTREEADKARDRNMARAQEKAKANDKIQIDKEDKVLQDYFKKNNIQVVKAPLGTYVQIIQPGNGPKIDTSMIITANYTGRLLNGKTFDSNTDPAFNHVSPLTVNMTSDPAYGNPVMKGWYDGLSMLSKGAKAKFFIPSPLAYGPQGAGQDILPNSTLMIDIEVLDILTKEQALKAITAETNKMRELQKKFTDSMSKAHPDTTRK
jgi:FKBP-type peptidyl-prolyl cis-trans isomerase